MTRSVLFVVSADLPQKPPQTRPGPRKDYEAIIDALDPTILDRTMVGKSILARVIAKFFGVPIAQACLAFRRHGAYDVILTDGEHIGIPLALMLKFVGARTSHITIGHRISSRKKRLFFRWLRIHRHIARILVHSKLQKDFATSQLGLAEEQVVPIPFQADTDYWRPQPVSEERLVCSAGLEHRDYPTLFRAMEGLDARAIIGAASHWSRQSNTALDVKCPPNVEVSSFDYQSLRQLYARAAVVVVPIFDVDFQAGITTILEAMAMGKAVIVTHALGQTDVVEDRRSVTRSNPPRPRPVSLLQELANHDGVQIEPNGFYVPVNDATALRNAIVYLLERPEERARLGAAGRKAVERFMTPAHFAARIQALVEDLNPNAVTGNAASEAAQPRESSAKNSLR